MFWETFLDPASLMCFSDELAADRFRNDLFESVVGLSSLCETVPELLRSSTSRVAQFPLNPTSRTTLQRASSLEASHRIVLLKAASEWIDSRYRRGMNNWQSNHSQWLAEKAAWENSHPDLAPERRDSFTRIYKQLINDEDAPKVGVRRKRARICSLKTIDTGRDDCLYAGERGHGPLCHVFAAFVKERSSESKRFNTSYFFKDATSYLRIRKESANREIAFQKLLHENRSCPRDFQARWDAYLAALNLNEATIVQRGKLPHCEKLTRTEKTTCQWNPHTNLCVQYARMAAGLDAETRTLESQYREWRSKFLAAPRKPSFKYPSGRVLPTPKIFGEGYFAVDLGRSVLRVRLEATGSPEWLEFGIQPWPRLYKPDRSTATISSAHITFTGVRPRVGLRFQTPHAISRFACSQDDIDQLRSQQYPRQSQDQQFLDAAREMLFEPASPIPQDVRVLAVDLGEVGASAAVFAGRQFEQDIELRLLKIDRNYSTPPENLSPASTSAVPPSKSRGLRKEHVGVHYDRLAMERSDVARYRNAKNTHSQPRTAD
jgi:hypothetical protein